MGCARSEVTCAAPRWHQFCGQGPLLFLSKAIKPADHEHRAWTVTSALSLLVKGCTHFIVPLLGMCAIWLCQFPQIILIFLKSFLFFYWSPYQKKIPQSSFWNLFKIAKILTMNPGVHSQCLSSLFNRNEESTLQNMTIAMSNPCSK